MLILVKMHLETISINNSCKVSITVLIVFLTLGAYLYSMPYAVGQTGDAEAKLQAANNTVTYAFNAVLDAERAGANVTDLLVQLNDAAGILAQAENAYRNGDNNTVMNNVDSVLPITQEVTTAAQTAKETASISAQNTLWLTIVLSVIGVFAFVSVLFLVWRRFRRNYVNNLSEAKPEVSSFEV